jgi:2,3-bisphosphoglycerate-dependent phosphoglycerate mutase
MLFLRMFWRLKRTKKVWSTRMKLSAIHLSAINLILALAIIGYGFNPSDVTTVIVVRHAEKSSTPRDNPPLTEQGQARAAALARILRSAGVTAIYSSPFLRTLQTVQPLARQLGLSIDQVDAKEIKGLVDKVLKDHSGQVVVISGHSNTVPLIVEALGAGTIPPISDTEYDNLYIVTVYGPGKAKVVGLKFE